MQMAMRGTRIALQLAARWQQQRRERERKAVLASRIQPSSATASGETREMNNDANDQVKGVEIDGR